MAGGWRGCGAAIGGGAGRGAALRRAAPAAALARCARPRRPPARPPPADTLAPARVFCARRLKSLYKALKFLHGKGRYQKRKLEAHLITDARWLLIPLLCAERAWAQAMEIKKDNEDRQLPRRRHHGIRRLAKAAVWAGELARFTAGAAGWRRRRGSRGWWGREADDGSRRAGAR
jgi:hypothetical protein